MKAVMISIRSEWAEMIARRKKTVEVRKNRPKIEVPFKCYIYCTKGKSKDNWGEVYGGYVIGEFTCNRIKTMSVSYKSIERAARGFSFYEETCLTDKQIIEYLGNGVFGYGWCIDDLKIYDKPKNLCEFTKYSDDDIRPCQNGDECQYEHYDYSEDCFACGVDFDGDNCPYIKLQRPPQSWCYVEEL